MATQKSEGKSTLDKIIDIVHTMVHSDPEGGDTSKDPVSDTIKTLSDKATIGGGYQKARMDKAISESGG